MSLSIRIPRKRHLRHGLKNIVEAVAEKRQRRFFDWVDTQVFKFTSTEDVISVDSVDATDDVDATQTFVMTGYLTTGETITIGDQIIEVVSNIKAQSESGTNQLYAEDDLVLQMGFLTNLINGESGEQGSGYYTAADFAVTATNDGTDTITVTAVEGGAAGNETEMFATDSVFASWTGTDLAGGVDGDTVTVSG
ncbi:MAG: hypothetical protein ACR2NF_08905, partial [Pirellulales bacterium]